MGFYLLTVKEDADSINLPHSDCANEECAIVTRVVTKRCQQTQAQYSFLKVIKALKTYRTGTGSTPGQRSTFPCSLESPRNATRLQTCPLVRIPPPHSSILFL